MARRDRTVTHSEEIDLNARFKVRIDVESENAFDLISLNLLVHDLSEGWKSANERLWFDRPAAAEMIRATLRALKAIEARRGKGA